MLTPEEALKQIEIYQKEHKLEETDILCVIGPVSFSVSGVKRQVEADSKTGKFLRENLSKLLSDELVPIIVQIVKEKH